MSSFQMTVRGTYALLTHNPLAMMSNGKDEAKASKAIKQAYDPAEEAQRGCYYDNDGHYAIPGISFRNSILAASSAFKMPRPNHRKSVVHFLSSMMVLEDLVTLINDDGTPVTSYTVDSRRALVQGQGIIRSRPKFNEWGAKFTVEFDEDLGVTDELITMIAVDAGKRIGVGDYRPQKLKGLPGPYGRYAVVSPNFE